MAQYPNYICTHAFGFWICNKTCINYRQTLIKPQAGQRKGWARQIPMPGNHVSKSRVTLPISAVEQPKLHCKLLRGFATSVLVGAVPDTRHLFQIDQMKKVYDCRTNFHFLMKKIRNQKIGQLILLARGIKITTDPATV